MLWVGSGLAGFVGRRYGCEQRDDRVGRAACRHFRWRHACLHSESTASLAMHRLMTRPDLRVCVFEWTEASDAGTMQAATTARTGLQRDPR
jgi:hypothetical protein